MRKFVLIILCLLYACCLSACDDRQKSGDITENSIDFEQEQQDVLLEEKKRAAVFEVAENSFKRNSVPLIASDMRSIEIVATDGNWYVVCAAYDNLKLGGGPREAFATFYVEHFYEDTDGQFRAVAKGIEQNCFVLSEYDDKFPCMSTETLRAAASCGNWYTFKEEYIVQTGIDAIVSSKSYRSSGNVGSAYEVFQQQQNIKNLNVGTYDESKENADETTSDQESIWGDIDEEGNLVDPEGNIIMSAENLAQQEN